MAVTLQGVDNMVIEERIAAFFEERSYFYDQAHSLFRNRQRKSSELDEFARKIGWTAKQVSTRFTSNRTDHGKLKNPRATKSGQAPRRLTLKQRFKLERYAFLDAYMKPRSDFEVMGKLPGPKGADEDDDEDDDAQDEAEYGTSIMARAGAPEDGGSRASSVRRPRQQQQQQKRKKQPVADLLTEMQKEAEVAKKMEAALQGEEVVTERTAWGKWLASTAQTVPGSAWRDYQRDMFAVAMRYMPVTAGDPVLTAESQTLSPLPSSSHRGHIM